LEDVKDMTHPTSPIEEGKAAPSSSVVHRHRVRYHEADAQGFFFNSRFLELADVAMTEYFRGLGFPYLELVAGGADPSVVSADLQFLAPARFEDLLWLSVSCVRVGRSSFVLAMKVWRDHSRLADMTLTYVNVDPVTTTSRPLPDPVAAALRGDVTPRGPQSWQNDEDVADPQ
jgi:acyl-CoA thioester hydrolase